MRVKWMLNTELTKKCKQFVMAHWGKDGLKQVQERPVSWVRHEANPQLKLLRRKRKGLPLISIHGTVNRIHLALSTEKRRRHDA
jgi:hypothetical protein